MYEFPRAATIAKVIGPLRVGVVAEVEGVPVAAGVGDSATEAVAAGSAL